MKFKVKTIFLILQLHNNHYRYESLINKFILFLLCLLPMSTCGFLLVLLQLSLINGKDWPPTPCDPLVPQFCSLPWPNDYWLQKDDNYNPMNLVFDEINLPITKNGITTNPAYWNTLDGWAPLPAIMAYWNNLSIDNCARFWYFVLLSPRFCFSNIGCFLDDSIDDQGIYHNQMIKIHQL